MKPLKSSSWLAHTVWLLALAVCAAAAHAAPEPVDPLAGDWFYHSNQTVTFKADGTVTNTNDGSFGTWEYLHNPEVQRHYRVIWSQGKYIDGLVLSEDGQSLRIHNEAGGKGNRYEGRRAIPDKPAGAPPDKNDPLIGDWLWFKGRPVTFNADGTVTGPEGTVGVWEYLHNPGAERKYRVNFGHGKYIDTFTCTADAQTAHVISQHDSPYDVHRVSSAAPTSPGQESHPFGVPGH